MRMLLNNKYTLWLLLALPGAAIGVAAIGSETAIFDSIAPSGEWSARLMIAAMMLGPLADWAGPRPIIRWLIARRRAMGVAAFCYAALHLLLYVTDLASAAAIWEELFLPAIAAGWAAMALMIPLALTSNGAAMAMLKAGWKKLQRLVYPAAILSLLHWIWVHNNPAEAMIHFTPLLLLYIARAAKYKIPQKSGA